MTDLAFYHLQKSPLEVVLPKLLEKTLAAGKRAIVLVSSTDRAEALAAHLQRRSLAESGLEDITVWSFRLGGRLLAISNCCDRSTKSIPSKSAAAQGRCALMVRVSPTA
jgi:hypothetical protein